MGLGFHQPSMFHELGWMIIKVVMIVNGALWTLVIRWGMREPIVVKRKFWKPVIEHSWHKRKCREGLIYACSNWKQSSPQFCQLEIATIWQNNTILYMLCIYNAFDLSILFFLWIIPVHLSILHFVHGFVNSCPWINLKISIWFFHVPSKCNMCFNVIIRSIQFYFFELY